MEGIGSTLELEQVLTTATAEVALVMQVKASSVKLLTEDGKFLRYAAAFGLPESFVRNQVVEVARSPLNRRIIDGEPFVTGQVTAKEMFRFRGSAERSTDPIRALRAPACREPGHGDPRGLFLQISHGSATGTSNSSASAAGPELVAIAIENARAYEAVKTMSNERNWFMMKVTHNLRAPLAGMLSILEVVREGYLGAINEEQSEYLRRLDRRARTMLSMINGLMALSRNRERTRLDPNATTAPEELARRVRRTFQDKAAEKQLAFQVNLPESLPLIRGPLETLEQLLENLVSNAIKYTPAEGSVEVMKELADLADHHRQAARVVEVLHQVLARRHQVDEAGHVAAEPVPVVERQLDADAAGDREQVHDGVGRAADRAVDHDRVLERLAW